MLKNVSTFVIRNHWYYICKIMINRINLILRAKNITAKQFAEEIGIQPSGMSHILSGRNNPSLDFVSKVIRRYPEIDANWLLMGKGEMYGDLKMNRPEGEMNGWKPKDTMAKNEGLRLEQEQPTLFSEPLPASTPIHEPAPAPMTEAAPTPIPEPEPAYVPEPKEHTQESLEHEEAEQEKEVLKEKTAPIGKDGRKMVKILFFYDDRTFEEYRPL